MTSSFRTGCWTSMIAAAVLGVAMPAHAQTTEGAARGTPPQPAEEKLEQPAPAQTLPSWKGLFGDTLRDFKHLPSRGSAQWLAVGGLAALGSRPADARFGRTLAGSPQLHETVEAGAIIGGTPFELGAAVATLAIGRRMNSPRVARVGADLVRAQLVAEGLTMGVKQVVRRSRPEGEGFAFPSGHTSVTFASATVLQRHFGWKAGIPAYAVAGYVAMSRVQMQKHYLSDVAFGAALGILAARTVTIGHGRSLEVAPLAAPGGAGVSFTWLGKTPDRRNDTPRGDRRDR